MAKRLYVCEFCNSRYTSLKLAEKCEAQPMPAPLKVGTIVTKYDGYGWMTGPDYWVASWDKSDKSRGADGRGVRHFYWVVMDVYPEKNRGYSVHCNRVILATRGVVNGPQTVPPSGWGCTEHVQALDPNYAGAITVAKKPPSEIVAECADFMKRFRVNVDKYGARTVVER